MSVSIDVAGLALLVAVFAFGFVLGMRVERRYVR